MIFSCTLQETLKTKTYNELLKNSDVDPYQLDADPDPLDPYQLCICYLFMCVEQKFNFNDPKHDIGVISVDSFASFPIAIQIREAKMIRIRPYPDPHPHHY